MSDDAERWKEKYLKGIEQQDRLEKRWDARLDLLRRGLVRSSLAAEGSDRAVDECMKEMREIVRTDDMDAGLAALIPRLEKAVLDSEQRREVRVGQISSALTALVERASQARELPLLLGELSNLQGQALSQLEKSEEGPRQGLLQRLFGTREGHGSEHPSEAAQAETVQTDTPAPAPQLREETPEALESATAPTASPPPLTPAPVEIAEPVIEHSAVPEPVTETAPPAT
ncbi:Diguanylate cye, partial [Pseudomonas coronafaciens pv. garcae]